jgi:hypothetical protein
MPVAFFPLSNFSTQSWPLPELAFFNTSEQHVGWTTDNTFGSVVSCPVCFTAESVFWIYI